MFVRFLILNSYFVALEYPSKQKYQGLHITYIFLLTRLTEQCKGMITQSKQQQILAKNYI